MMREFVLTRACVPSLMSGGGTCNFVDGKNILYKPRLRKSDCLQEGQGYSRVYI
jgi:hypothetical protein